MRTLNTDELRQVYGGHGNHHRGKKKGHGHACATASTRHASTTRRNSTTRRKKHDKKY
jgi:bacteriocin-like protein